MVMSHMLYRTDQSSSACRTVSVSTLGRERSRVDWSTGLDTNNLFLLNCRRERARAAN